MQCPAFRPPIPSPFPSMNINRGMRLIYRMRRDHCSGISYHIVIGKKFRPIQKRLRRESMHNECLLLYSEVNEVMEITWLTEKCWYSFTAIQNRFH
jgi:hypothetical protein